MYMGISLLVYPKIRAGPGPGPRQAQIWAPGPIWARGAHAHRNLGNSYNIPAVMSIYKGFISNCAWSHPTNDLE